MTFGMFFPNDARVISNSFHTAPSGAIAEDVLQDKVGKIIHLGQEFTLSSTWYDQINYMRMANGEEADAPFKYRLLYPNIVRLMIGMEDFLFNKISFYQSLDRYRKAQLNFWVLNFISLLLGAFFLKKLLNCFTKDHELIMLLLVLFLTQYGVLFTATFAMIDVFSYMLFCVFLYLLVNRQWLTCSFLLVVMSLSKEAFVICTPALLAMYLETKQKALIGLSVIPVTVFVMIRLTMGESAVSVENNWNVMEGKFELKYLSMHLGSISGFTKQLVGIVLAYGITVIYLPRIFVLKRFGMLYFSITFSSLLLLAQLILSIQISRVLALALPLWLMVIAINFVKIKKVKT